MSIVLGICLLICLLIIWVLIYDRRLLMLTANTLSDLLAEQEAKLAKLTSGQVYNPVPSQPSTDKRTDSK